MPRHKSKGQPADDYKSVFDAYVKLGSESYEFITRTTAMHNWLREAYRLWEQSPDLSPEELEEAWRPAFDRVYGHLFAPFLRPYRLMIYPLGELSKAYLRSWIPKTPAETYLDVFRMWGEAQSRFLKAIAGGFQSWGASSLPLASGNGDGAIDEFSELAPLKLMGKVAEEEVLAYYETLDELVKYLGENQLILPKAYFLHLQRLISCYPQSYRAAERYELMLRQTWQRSLKEFSGRITEHAGPPVKFEEFFDSFVTTFADEYDRLLGSAEFIEAQNSYLASTSDAVTSIRKVMEAQVELFPWLPFVTQGEMESLEHRVHSYKRRLDAVERRAWELEDLEQELARMDSKVEDLLTREELEGLERKLAEMDQRLTAMSTRIDVEGPEGKTPRKRRNRPARAEEETI